MAYCDIVALLLRRRIGADKLQQRGVDYMEVDVSEAEKQTAIFRHALPTTEVELKALQDCMYPPAPCLAVEA